MLAIPRKQRAMVRKGIKEELRVEIDESVDRHYDIYTESLRNLGTPPFSRNYLRVLKEVFGERCDIVSILKGDRIVASVLNFYFRDEVLPYYGGGTLEARAVAGNDFMYWSVMERARDRGCRIFDYGRSKRGTGAFDFKTYWGFEPEPLYYEYFLVKRKEMPNLSPTNPEVRQGHRALAQAAAQAHAADRPADRQVPGVGRRSCAAFTASSALGAGSPRRSPDVLKRMGDAMMHRGPDDSGAFFDDELLLGMRRLSIIDVAGGHQPIASEDGQVVAVCNGEIYNFRALRSELQSKGHRFATNSDSETAVHAYEEYGDAFLNKLDGMFGVAVWDRRRRRLVVARDALGIKPIYYRQDASELMFASEAKSILAVPGVQARLDSSCAGPVPVGRLCLRAEFDLRWA